MVQALTSVYEKSLAFRTFGSDAFVCGLCGKQYAPLTGQFSDVTAADASCIIEAPRASSPSNCLEREDAFEMKLSLRPIASALVLFGAPVMPSLAQQKGTHEAEFRTFYAAFLKAAQANDKEKIADMIAYPVSSWSIQTKKDV